MDVVQEFKKFDLDTVSEDWVQFVLDNEYMDVDEIPGDYDEYLNSIDVTSILHNVISALKFGHRNGNARASTSTTEHNVEHSLDWMALQEENIQPKVVTCLLCYLITTSQKNPNDERARQICLKSSSIYFLLVILRGSRALQIFHPNLFSKAVDTFQLKRLLRDGKKNSSSKTVNDVPSPNQEAEGVAADHARLLFGTEVRHEVLKNLSVHEQLNLTSGINNLLHEFLSAIKAISLKNNKILIDHCVNQLVDLTRLETERSDFTFGSFITRGQTHSLASNAYLCLKCLCNRSHGNVGEIVKMIMSHFLPNVIMTKPFGWNMSFRELCVISDHTIKFIHYLCKDLRESTLTGVLILVQKLALKIQDRAEHRQKGAKNVVSLVKILPDSLYSQYMVWLVKFARNEKVHHRLFALEVISSLLYEDEPTVISSSFSPNEDRQHQHRSSASMPSDNATVPNHIPMELDSENHEDGDSESTDSDNPDANDNSRRTFQGSSGLNLRNVSLHKHFLAVIFSRCVDVSALVRTKALSAIVNSIQSNNAVINNLMKEIFVSLVADCAAGGTSAEDPREFVSYALIVKCLETNCHLEPLPSAKAVIYKLENLINDDKVFVRKGALQLLEHIRQLNDRLVTTELLEEMSQHCGDPSPLIRKEMVQMLTTMTLRSPDHQLLPKLVIENLLPLISDTEARIQEKVLEAMEEMLLHNLAPYSDTHTGKSVLPWVLTGYMLKLKMQRHLKILCDMWSKTGSLRSSFIPIIESHIGTKNDTCAWLLLSYLAPHIAIKRPEKILDSYKDAASRHNTQSLRLHLMLQVLFHCWNHLPEAVYTSWSEELLASLHSFQIKCPCIDTIMDIVTAIRKRLKSCNSHANTWALNLFKECVNQLSYLNPSTDQMPDAEVFRRHLFTLGATVQLCPKQVDLTKFKVLLDFVFNQQSGVKENVKNMEGIMPLAVITVGKLSLLNEKIAQKVIPQLGTLLAQSWKSAAYRVNIISVLADLCTRYTALVDPLLPQMFLCLKDKNDIVRNHAVVKLVELLQEDYLKLKGGLFYQMLTMLVDRKEAVQGMIGSYLTDVLLPKSPAIMYQHFVESIFHYNNYMGHKQYCLFTLSAEERKAFDISGKSKTRQRREIYAFMLQHMNDEQRLKTMYNLSKHILDGATKEQVSLSAEGLAVLEDTFYCLGSEEIRLSGIQLNNDETHDDPADILKDACTRAKKAVLSQCLKKSVIEFVVPSFIQLKHKLKADAAYHFLIPQLMLALRNLVKDYKKEVAEIFENDEVTGAEVLYDINQYEKEKRHGKQTDDSSLSSDENDRVINALQAILPPSCKVLATDEMPLNHLGSLLPLPSTSHQRTTSPSPVPSTSTHGSPSPPPVPSTSTRRSARLSIEPSTSCHRPSSTLAVMSNHESATASPVPSTSSHRLPTATTAPSSTQRKSVSVSPVPSSSSSEIATFSPTLEDGHSSEKGKSTRSTPKTSVAKTSSLHERKTVSSTGSQTQRKRNSVSTSNSSKTETKRSSR